VRPGADRQTGATSGPSGWARQHPPHHCQTRLLAPQSPAAAVQGCRALHTLPARKPRPAMARQRHAGCKGDNTQGLASTWGHCARRCWRASVLHRTAQRGLCCPNGPCC
jgi:hypothetical protein